MPRIRSSILAALAHGIAVDDDLAARRALGKLDLVVRGRAKKQLGAALLDAELAVSAAGIAKPSRAHVQRVAALALLGKDAHAGDPAVAEAAFAQLPPVVPPTFPLYTTFVALAVLGAAGAIGFVIATRPGPKPRVYERPTQPEIATAYKTGGVPLHDPALEHRLGGDLGELVVAVNRDLTSAEPTLKKQRDTTLGHGAAVDTAWQGALDALGEAAGNHQLGPDHLREAVRELGEQLNAAGYGYFLEGRIKNDAALIQSYRVEEVVFVTAGGKPRRVLSLHRLDHLNTAYAALGLYNEEVGDPTLHLERIAEFVATTELPALAPDAPYPLAEQTWLATRDGAALAKQLADAVRREYAVALGVDFSAATRTAALLAERASIIDQWREHLERKHIVFSPVDNLFVPEQLLTALDGIVPHYQHERVEAIDAELAELDAPRIHARIHDLIAATVRRHEAQHGFDFDRDTELHYPQELDEMLGPPEREGRESAIVASARAELAGYLSQILNDPATPQSAFGHLAQQAFSGDRAGTGEFYAGIVVIEGLARHLGAVTTSPRWSRGLDRERLARLALSIAKATDVQLRDAARALWLDLFHEPPTEIKD